MIRLLALLFVFGAFAQPPIQSYDQQIQRSDFFAEEYPNYPVCKIENLTMIDDVSDGTVGQCLKKLTATTWGGGQCGTGGGSGFDFDSAQADQQHAWKFAVQQLPLTASINFVTGSCPATWGTNCWSQEPRAIVGSYVGVNGGSPPSDVVLISNTRIAYASASNKRASSVWLGNTQYKVDFIAHNGLLGTRQVVYSTLSTQLPGTNWQNLRLEFSDGTFAPATTGTAVNRTTDKANLIQYLNLQAFNPSQSNLYPAIKDIIKAGSNVTLSPSDSNNTLTIGSTGGGGSGVLEAYDQIPPDLTNFRNNQIIAVNNPAQGFLEVSGSNTQHGFKINGAVDPNNANNYGASYTGDMYGSLSTEEGGQPLNASSSCIERFEVQMNVGGDDTLTVLIKKTCLTTAPATIYYRIYQKPVGSSGDELATGSLTKGPDNTAHSYHTYLSPSGDGTANLLWSDKDNVKYVRFFSSNPATDDETSNPLNLHPSKTTTAFANRGGGPTVTKINIVDALPQSPSTGDVVLLREENSLNLYYYTGDGDYNPVYSREPSRDIDVIPSLINLTANSTRFGLARISDDNNYIYLSYPTAGSSSYFIASTLSAYIALRRFAKSTGMEDISFRKIFLTPFSRPAYIGRFVIYGNYAYYTFSFQTPPNLSSAVSRINIYWKDIRTTTGCCQSTSAINGPDYGSDYINHLGKSGNSIISIQVDTSQTIRNSKAEWNVGDNGVLSIRSRENIRVSTGFSTNDDTYFYSHDGFNNYRAYTISDFTRTTARDFTLPLIGTNTRVYYPLIGQNYIRFLPYGSTSDSSTKIYAISYHSGGWQRVADGVILPESSVTLSGSGIPNDLLGVEGHFYFDKNNKQLYVKEMGVWQLVGYTPRRVSTLPAESSSLDGEQCYITANYTKNNGINITPQLFAGTELDSVTNSDAPSNLGTQGWYRKADAGFTFGEINPDLPSDFVLISDKRVYVKDNTQTNLAKILLGTTEYTLTRVNQTTTKLFSTPGPSGPNNPLVDYYTIGGTGLPASGDWDDLRFETTTANTFVPATTTIPKGLYENRNSDWVRGGFDAPEVQPDKDFKIAVEEQRPGTRADKNLPFTASGSTFTTTTPFPGILRITYNNLSTDTDTYQRYTVFVPLDGFQDSKAPHLLKIGSVNYSLAYFETDAGQGVYRTPVVKSTERITSASTRNAMNVQALDNSWFGETGAGKFLKTITKHDLSVYANAIQEVHALPGSPHEGQRIQLLNDLTVSGGAVMTAQESAGTDSRGTSITGLFTGYEVDAKYDNGSTGGDLGSLDPTNTNFAGLLSFSNARSSGSEANKTFFVSPNGNTYAPSKVWINGVRYSVGSAVNRDFFPLTGLDGSFIKSGKKYYVNAENSSGTKLFADQSFKAGDELIYTGINWIKGLQGLAEQEVDNRIDAKVPQQFRNDADTTGQLFQPKCFWKGTEAQYTSATKVEDCIYYRGP